MAVAASELGSKGASIQRDLFPEFRTFIQSGEAVKDHVIELLAPEEIIWLREARNSSIKGEQIHLPCSRNTYPHLTGFTLTEKSSTEVFSAPLSDKPNEAI
jgi:hypothetical protein